MQNLRTILAGQLIQRAVEACASSLKCASGDIVLQELLVHNVDDSRNENLYVFGASD